MKKLTKYFFNGLVFLVPLVATVYVVYLVFVKIDTLFSFAVPGLGFVVTIIVITVIGFIGSNFLTRKLIHLVDILFSRLPVIKMFYTSVKDLVGAFVGDKKGFNKPVSVALSPGTGLRAIGFVTSESLNNLGLSDSVAVYLPQSYNFAGNLIIVPKEHITPLSADSGYVMKFVVSGGIASR
ncbi:MAG: DUF502 domain-containing protein [Candidatus Mariimomonas ferrooxydans]